MLVEVEVDIWEVLNQIDDDELLQEVKARELSGFAYDQVAVCNKIVDLMKAGKKDLAQAEIANMLYEVTGRSV